MNKEIGFKKRFKSRITQEANIIGLMLDSLRCEHSDTVSSPHWTNFINPEFVKIWNWLKMSFGLGKPTATELTQKMAALAMRRSHP